MLIGRVARRLGIRGEDGQSSRMHESRATRREEEETRCWRCLLFFSPLSYFLPPPFLSLFRRARDTMHRARGDTPLARSRARGGFEPHLPRRPERVGIYLAISRRPSRVSGQTREGELPSCSVGPHRTWRRIPHHVRVATRCLRYVIFFTGLGLGIDRYKSHKSIQFASYPMFIRSQPLRSGNHK